MAYEDLLKTLLKARSPSEISAYDIASKAYHRSSRKQYLEAAVLFEASAARSDEEFDSGEYDKVNEAGVRINQSLNAKARAGFNYCRAGDQERGLKLLRACVDADWLAAGLNHDLMTVARAFVYLLRDAGQRGRAAFEETFAEAERRCEAMGMSFASETDHPSRIELATLARTLGCEALAQRLVSSLRGVKPMKRTIKAFIEAFDAGEVGG